MGCGVQTWVRCTPDLVRFAFFKVYLAELISKEPYLAVYLLKTSSRFIASLDVIMKDFQPFSYLNLTLSIPSLHK